MHHTYNLHFYSEYWLNCSNRFHTVVLGFTPSQEAKRNFRNTQNLHQHDLEKNPGESF